MALGFVLVNSNAQQFGTTSPSGQGLVCEMKTYWIPYWRNFIYSQFYFWLKICSSCESADGPIRRNFCKRNVLLPICGTRSNTIKVCANHASPKEYRWRRAKTTRFDHSILFDVHFTFHHLFLFNSNYLLNFLHSKRCNRLIWCIICKSFGSYKCVKSVQSVQFRWNFVHQLISVYSKWEMVQQCDRYVDR